ncbi:MAG: TlpA family protein disulfide reductase [Gammaproteobacteria bacterium]
MIVGVALIAGAAGYLTRLSTQVAGSGDVAESASVSDQSSDIAGVATNQQAKPLWFWAFEDLEGKERLLSEWQGPFLVVNFWATWCPPCLKEIPSFMELQNEFGADKVQFLGIAYDHLEAVKDFVAERGMNYPVLLGGDDVAVFMRELGNKIGALPFTAVINSSGQVVNTHQGEWHREDATAALQALLATGSQSL